MLKGEERRLFSLILERQALEENGKWFIDEDGPIFDMELVMDALDKGKRVSLRSH